MIYKIISTFVYRNRMQLYDVYTSKFRNKVLWNGVCKRVGGYAEKRHSRPKTEKPKT